MGLSFLNVVKMLGSGRGADPLVQQLLPLLQGGGDVSGLLQSLLDTGGQGRPGTMPPAGPTSPVPAPPALQQVEAPPYAPGDEPTSGADALRRSGRSVPLEGAMPAPTGRGMDSGARRQQLFDALLRDFADQSPDVPGGTVPGPQKWGHLKTGQPHPGWFLMPGFGKGYAERQQLDREQEELKLRREALKGQQAVGKLKLFEAVAGLEEREGMARVGRAMGGLERHADLLDPQGRAELTGTITQELARQGKIKELTDLQTLWQERAGVEEMRRVEELRAGGPAPAPPLGQEPAQAPAPAPGVAPGGGNVAAVMDRLIRDEATRQGVDPDLAVAVARQESGLNPQARGDNGQSIGLFQLQEAAARDAGIDPGQRLDPRVNIRGGVTYLKQKLAQSGGNVDQALSRYNRGTPTYQGRGDPNYEANVRRHLRPAAPDPRVAGPGAPAAPPAGSALQQDLTRLRTMEAERARLEQLLPLYRRASSSKAGKAAYDNAQQDLTRLTGEINTLRTRLWEQGPEKQQRAIDIARATQQTGLEAVAKKTLETERAKPLGSDERKKLNALLQAEDVATLLATEFTPEERATFVGSGGLRYRGKELQQLLDDVASGKADPRFARFASLVAMAQVEAFERAGTALTWTERDIVFGYLPTGREMSAQQFESKLKLAQERLPTYIEREMTLATTPRGELLEKRRRGELGTMRSSPRLTPWEQQLQDKYRTK